MNDTTAGMPPDYPEDTNGHPRRGLSVSQAAASLGLSVNAVRHKIRRGTLPAVKVDGEWRVQLVDDVPHRPAASPRTGGATDTPQDRPAESPLVSAQHQVDVLREGLVAPLVALTERQQAIIAEQARDLGRITAERDHERQLREALESRVRELEAQAMESPSVAESAPPANDTAPWWQFWRRQ